MKPGNRHPLHEFYTHLAEGKTPNAFSFNDYGITETMRPRVRRDAKDIHALRDAGERQQARDLAAQRASSLIADYFDHWTPPAPEDPRALAAQIHRH